MISKKQTFEILTMIKEYYEQFEITQSKIDAWYLALKDYEYDIILRNLVQYSKEHKFAPKIADLISEKTNEVDRIHAIPNVEETLEYLHSISRKTEISEDEQQLVEKSKEKIRKILGIG